MQLVTVALVFLLSLGPTAEVARAQTSADLPAALAGLDQGFDRCGQPSAEQWALTLTLSPEQAAVLARRTKVIPYRFILEDLVAAAVAERSPSLGSAGAGGGASPRRKAGSIEAPANIFGFTGHEMDRETGLVYMKGRFYDPEVARFLSPDPFAGRLAEPPSLHPYLYAYANPTVYVDPDGRCVGKLQQTPVCQAIAEVIAWWITGDPDAAVAPEIERREKVVAARRAFREAMGRDPRLDEVVWSENGRALTAGFEEVDTSGRIEPDHVEWMVVGSGIGARMAVGAARAAGAGAARQFAAGATQVADDAIGELTGVSPGDIADLARLARRPSWDLPTAPATSSPSGLTVVVESADRVGVEQIPVGMGGVPVSSGFGHGFPADPGRSASKRLGPGAPPRASNPGFPPDAFGSRARAPEFPGGQVSESGFVDSALQYLGPGYREISPGRYVSGDGLRQVRFGAHEVRGTQLHGHFEAFDIPYAKGGRVIENTMVRITGNEVP